MLDIPDRDFLLGVLALPAKPHLRFVQEMADRLIRRLLDESAPESMTARELAMRVVALPVPPGEELEAVKAAAGILKNQVDQLLRQEFKPTLKAKPDPKFTRRQLTE